MKEGKPFEIPEQIRKMAEQNLEQAQSAYDQFMAAARKAQELVIKSSSAMGTGVQEIQERALKFTQENMDANFKFARQLASATDMQQAVEMQTRFAKEQMETYAFQAQELGVLMNKAAAKARPK